jgi:hypothetical protein
MGRLFRDAGFNDNGVRISNARQYNPAIAPGVEAHVVYGARTTFASFAGHGRYTLTTLPVRCRPRPLDTRHLRIRLEQLDRVDVLGF